MEHSQALRKLQESADLVKMVEELLLSGNPEKLSSAVLGGLRITLRSVRENVLESHDRLAGTFVEKARLQQEIKPQVNIDGANTATSNSSTMTITPPISTIIKNSGSPAPVEAPAAAADKAALSSEAARAALLSDPERLQMMRRDLRASLQKIVENR